MFNLQCVTDMTDIRDDWKAPKTFDGVSYECTIVYQSVLGFFFVLGVPAGSCGIVGDLELELHHAVFGIVKPRLWVWTESWGIILHDQSFYMPLQHGVWSFVQHKFWRRPVFTVLNWNLRGVCVGVLLHISDIFSLNRENWNMLYSYNV